MSGHLWKKASRASFCFLQFRKRSAHCQASWGVKIVRKLNVVPCVTPYSQQLRNNYFWLLPEPSKFLTRGELKLKSFWPFLLQVRVLFPLLSYSWTCLVSKEQLFKILFRQHPRISLKSVFGFAFKNLSSPHLQRPQSLDVFGFPIPCAYGSTRGSFCTLKLCQLYLGVGEPSRETQVRLIFCPYCGVPTMLHSGLDGATEGRKKELY